MTNAVDVGAARAAGRPRPGRRRRPARSCRGRAASAARRCGRRAARWRPRSGCRPAPSVRATVGDDQRRVADRFERHEPDAVRELVGRRAPATCSDSRVLPVPPGPVRVSSRVVPSSSPASASSLVPADERGELGRQVVGPGVERAQRREVAGQAIDHELGQALGRAQVLQPMVPEVAEGDAVRQRPGDERPGRVAEQHLAAVRGRGDPRGLVDGVPDDVRRRRDSISPVWRPIRTRIGRAVRPRFRGDRPLRVGRRRRPRPSRRGRSRRTSRPRCPARARHARERGPQELAVPLQDVAVRAGPELELEPGRALDVAEQARHGPDRRAGLSERSRTGGASTVVISAGRLRSAVRSRPASPRRIARATAGCSWTTASKSQDASARQSVGTVGDDLGDARPAVEHGQLPEEVARTERRDRLAVADDRAPPAATMKKPVPTSPCRAMTWPAANVDLDDPVRDRAPAPGVHTVPAGARPPAVRSCGRASASWPPAGGSLTSLRIGSRA